MPIRTKSKNFKVVTVLLGISLLWAFDALRFDAWPEIFRRAPESLYFQRSALLWSVLALGAAVPAAARRAWPTKRQALHAALIGVGIFVVPALLTHATASLIADQVRVILFMLTPLFAVVLEPSVGSSNATPPHGNLLAALVAVAGGLMLFSFRLPNSIQEGGAFCLLVVGAAWVAATNCWAVHVTQRHNTDSSLVLAAIGAGTTALAFACLSMVFGSQGFVFHCSMPELLWTVIVDLPVLLGFYWLLDHMSATRMTLRFVLAPLFTALLSIVLFQPAVSLQSIGGLILMATGTGWILFVTKVDDTTPASLLPFNGDDGN
ncbi:MAG: hypothetical protein KGN79_14620 [Acidobacteriota bacterium]|nr:hypothetical protein [Acidobacteriota bacterium]